MEEERTDKERTDEVREEARETQHTPPVRWADHATHPEGSVFIETGRGQAVEAQVGAPFAETIERLADEAHYGGFFRVFLNGEELIEPEESPATIEPRMRIVITSYDKVA